ncbi:hypothetical protein ACFYP4_02970 [Streptomyces sp. NPDC005551]|uniref:hypothetical protein n=1 Tax=Streptomyces sp. NPDC005551 TaxID=3364725 RepID=UPI00367DA66F
MSRHFVIPVHVELPGEDDEEEILLQHLMNRIREAPGFEGLKGQVMEPEQI